MLNSAHKKSFAKLLLKTSSAIAILTSFNPNVHAMMGAQTFPIARVTGANADLFMFNNIVGVDYNGNSLNWSSGNPMQLSKNLTGQIIINNTPPSPYVLNITAFDLNGFVANPSSNISVTFQVDNGDVALGSVTAGGGNSAPLTIAVSNRVLTLTGLAGNVYYDQSNPTKNVFLSNNGNSNTPLYNNYAGLGTLDFQALGGTLKIAGTVNDPNSGAQILTPITLNNNFVSAGSANLVVTTPLVVTHSSAGSIGNVSIGVAGNQMMQQDTDTTYTIKPSNGPLMLNSNITFNTVKSELNINNSTNNLLTVNLGRNIGGNAANQGVIGLYTVTNNGNASPIILQNYGQNAFTLGTAQNPLYNFNLSNQDGNSSDITISAPVCAATVNIQQSHAFSNFTLANINGANLSFGANALGQATINSGNIGNIGTLLSGVGNLTIPAGAGAQTITSIGSNQTGSINSLTYNGGNNDTLSVTGTIYAVTTTIGGLGQLTAAQGISGFVNFLNNGTLIIPTGSMPTTVSVGANGKGNFTVQSGGNATITKIGGVNNSTNNLNTFTYAGNGADGLTITNMIYSNTTTISGTGTLAASGINGVLYFTDNGTFQLNGGNIAGAVTTNLGGRGKLVVQPGGGNAQNIASIGAQGAALNSFTYNGAGTDKLTVNGIIYAGTTTIGGTGTLISKSDNGSLNFTDNGTYQLNGGNLNAITTSTNNKGNLIVAAGGGNTQAINSIGALNKALNNFTYNGGSSEVLTTTQSIYAATITVGGAGKLIASGGISGLLNFTADGIFQLGLGHIGAVTTSVPGQGSLIINCNSVNTQTVASVGTPGAALKNFTYESIYTGSLTVNNSIFASVIHNGAGALTVNGNVTGDVAFNATNNLFILGTVNGNVTINSPLINSNNQISISGVSGNILFTADNIINFDAGSIISGAITTSLNQQGSVSIFSGNIGSIGAPNFLINKVLFPGASIMKVSGQVYVNNFIFSSNGTAYLQGNTVINKVDFGNQAGTLFFQGTTGTIGAFANILNGSTKSVLKINNGSLTVLDGTIGGLGSIVIGVAGASSLIVQDTNVNFSTSPTFYNASSSIVFNANAANRTLTLNSSLGGAGGDLRGILTLSPSGKNITVQDGGLSTGMIGQSSISRLKTLNLGQNGDTGNITLTSIPIFAQTVNVYTSGQITAGAFNTGNNGGLLFNVDGTFSLTSGNINTVTTSANNQGSLIVAAGGGGAQTITSIGVQGTALKKFTYNGGNGEQLTVGSIYATTTTIGGVGTLVASNGVNGNITYNADGILNLTLGGVTGSITNLTNAPAGTVHYNSTQNLGVIGAQGNLINKVILDGNSASYTMSTTDIYASTLYVNGGSKLNTNAATSNIRGALQVNDASTLVLNNSLTTTGALTTTGTPTLNLGGNNLTVNGGTLGGNVTIVTTLGSITNGTATAGQLVTTGALDANPTKLIFQINNAPSTATAFVVQLLNANGGGAAINNLNPSNVTIQGLNGGTAAIDATGKLTVTVNSLLPIGVSSRDKSQQSLTSSIVTNNSTTLSTVTVNSISNFLTSIGSPTATIQEIQTYQTTLDNLKHATTSSEVNNQLTNILAAEINSSSTEGITSESINLLSDVISEANADITDLKENVEKSAAFVEKLIGAFVTEVKDVVGVQKAKLVLNDMLGRMIAQPVVAGVHNVVNSALNSTIGAVMQGASATPLTIAGDLTAVAAGEESIRTGVWLRGFGGKAHQKHYENLPQYRSTQWGAGAGYDAALNEKLLLGLGFTFTNADIRYQGLQVGDKTNIRSLILSIYGVYDFTEKVFINGSVFAGQSKIKNDALRVTDVDQYGVAHSKYKSPIGGGNLAIGYRIIANDKSAFVPTIGVRYMMNQDDAYSETGNSFTNFSYGKRHNKTFSATAGVSANTSFMAKGVSITPELHVNYFRILKEKNSTFTRNLVGSNNIFTSKVPHASKNTCNIGTGLTFNTGKYEISTIYDGMTGKKYLSHQGTLKIKVNL